MSTHPGATTNGGTRRSAETERGVSGDGDAAARSEGAPGLEAEVEASVAELLSALTTDTTHLVRQEAELAKAEIREEISRTAKAGGMLAGAGVAGHMGLLLLSFALAWALAAVMATALAFLLVGVLYVIVAVALYTLGRQRLQEATPVPEQATESVQEDARWARDRIR